MPKLEVERSIEIHKSAEEVFAIVSNLGNWRPWNPWLVTEPEADVTVAPDGKQYSWKGKRTGEGSMAISSEKAPSLVHLDLTFLKPFKNHANVGFRIEPTESGCRVTWFMDSSMPFFLFFMVKMMTNLLKMDYDRGLSMLKDYAETGEVPSKISFDGETQYPGCEYVGITTECTMEEIGPKMSADLKRLGAFLEEQKLQAASDPFAVYEKWDLNRGLVKYTAGVPLKSIPSALPADLHAASLPAMKTFKLGHVGPYRHLGNVWSTGMQMARGKEFRQSKKAMPFETYPHKPGDVPENELRTDIHFPLR